MNETTSAYCTHGCDVSIEYPNHVNNSPPTKEALDNIGCILCNKIGFALSNTRIKQE